MKAGKFLRPPRYRGGMSKSSRFTPVEESSLLCERGPSCDRDSIFSASDRTATSHLPFAHSQTFVGLPSGISMIIYTLGLNSRFFRIEAWDSRLASTFMERHHHRAVEAVPGQCYYRL